jgi:ATP/ADP translocase
MEMSGSKIAGIVIAGITVAIIAFVVVLFLIKFLWAWTVPDLFPGAVQQGLVAGTISWWTAVKVAIFIAVLSGIAGGHKNHGKDSA